MPEKERRKHTRFDSLNLLSYYCLDKNKEIVMQGVGRTLEISNGGILLETHAPIDPDHVVSLVIAVENDLVDVSGKVTNTRGCEDDRFCTGIKFIDINESTQEVLNKFISMLNAEG